MSEFESTWFIVLLFEILIRYSKWLKIIYIYYIFNYNQFIGFLRFWIHKIIWENNGTQNIFWIEKKFWLHINAIGSATHIKDNIDI